MATFVRSAKSSDYVHTRKGEADNTGKWMCVSANETKTYRGSTKDWMPKGIRFRMWSENPTSLHYLLMVPVMDSNKRNLHDFRNTFFRKTHVEVFRLNNKLWASKIPWTNKKKILYGKFYYICGVHTSWKCLGMKQRLMIQFYPMYRD